jgi:hypothetical protein
MLRLRKIEMIKMMARILRECSEKDSPKYGEFFDNPSPFRYSLWEKKINLILKIKTLQKNSL